MINIHLPIVFAMMSVILCAQDESKLIIEANNPQSNSNPLIRLRNSAREDLLWIHSDNSTNTFIGVLNGVQNTPLFDGGIYNTFVGTYVGSHNTIGWNNTGIGYSAINRNSTGRYNTGAGAFALFNTTASEYNTALGYNAGGNFNNGYNNVFIGANTDVDKDDLFNVIAIGQGTTVTASSTARFGNVATTSYGGWADWSDFSDGRYKSNISESVVGLDFILKLHPVTYNLNAGEISKTLNESRGQEWDESMQRAIAEKEKVVQTGFIAQEVEKAARSVDFDFNGVDAPKNATDFYGLRYAKFVVPLVKAVQELNTLMVTQHGLLTAENEKLNERLKKVELLLGVSQSQGRSAETAASQLK